MRGRKTNTNLLTKEFLTTEYWEKGKTLRNMGKELGIGKSALRERMKALGIERRDDTARMKYRDILTEGFFMREFVGKGKTVWRIHVETGIQNKTVKKYLKRADIPLWMCGIYSNFEPKKGRHNPNARKLTREFLFMERIGGKSKRQIARENDVDYRTVHHRMEKFEVS